MPNPFLEKRAAIAPADRSTMLQDCPDHLLTRIAIGMAHSRAFPQAQRRLEKPTEPACLRIASLIIGLCCSAKAAKLPFLKRQVETECLLNLWPCWPLLAGSLFSCPAPHMFAIEMGIQNGTLALLNRWLALQP